jgi:hypothetical protein
MLEHVISPFGVLFVTLILNFILFVQLGHRSPHVEKDDVVSAKTQERKNVVWLSYTYRILGLRALLEEVLFAFSLTNIFSHPNAPSFFVVYAHDQTERNQPDECTVRKFIRYFELMRAQIRSDRSQNLSDLARANIFHTQSCLLPKRVATDPVDLVVLVHSEVLSNYCGEESGRKYMSLFKQASKPVLDELYQDHNSGSVSQQSIPDYQKIVKSLVNNQKSFHHVLTELAFVELRAVNDQNGTSIIPLSLRGENATISEDLPYLINTTHYCSMKHTWGPDTFEQQQRFFLGFVERIYGKAPDVIQFIKNRYDEGTMNIHNDPNMPIDTFRKEVRWQMSEELKRFSMNGPFEVADIKKHDYSDIWNVSKQHDRPTSDLQSPSELDITFKGLIPPWLLTDLDEKQKSKGIYIDASLC